jgi:hypothetical protein
LSTEDDREDLATFFKVLICFGLPYARLIPGLPKDKDTSKFELPLSQVLDSIAGNSACVKVGAFVGFTVYPAKLGPALDGKSPRLVGRLESVISTAANLRVGVRATQRSLIENPSKKDAWHEEQKRIRPVRRSGRVLPLLAFLSHGRVFQAENTTRSIDRMHKST